MFRPPPVTFTITSDARRTVRRICSIWPPVSRADSPGPRLARLTTSRGAGASAGTRNGHLLTAALPGDQGGFGEIVRLTFEVGEDNLNMNEVVPQRFPVRVRKG